METAAESLFSPFITGRLYYIDGYDFVYTVKEGIHHMFKEKNSGWTRTYTDYQLIGKKVVKL